VKAKFIIVFCGFIFGSSVAQQAVVRGIITNNNQVPIQNATVVSGSNGTTSNTNGFYSLQVQSNKDIQVIFQHIGYQNSFVKLQLEPGEIYELNPVINESEEQIAEVIVQANQQRVIKGMTALTPETIRSISGANAGVENLLVSLPGVNSNNELSTQYAVRGGNYDENLVYVNEIEVYRPQLIRSGQQEGLSFLNPDMIQQVQFSAGGFEASYGDKLSSVLDITYKSFSENQTFLSLSRLDGNLSWSLGNEKWSVITGLRYRNNGLLVDQKETETNFNPSFTDLQTFITYAHSDQLLFNVLGAFSVNTYRYEPLVRQTNFGTIEQPKSLVVYYDGNEKDKYTAFTGALKTTWVPNNNNSFRLILSNYQTVESEQFDILAQYRLGDPNTSIGGDDLGEVNFTEGVGSQLSHGRNNYGAQIIDGKLRGKHIKGNHQLDWGIGYKREHIDDRLVEWEVVDSAGFSIRPPSGSIINDQPYTSFTGPLVPFAYVRATNQTQIQRITSFFQWSHRGLVGNTLYWLTAGIRGQRWQLDNEIDKYIASPRMQFSFRPKNKDHVLYRFATGLYAQPPFYRELRSRNGLINPDVDAQKAIHLSLGNNYRFFMWNRPFLFQSEFYYKHLDQLNAYTVENVRIRYDANNNTKGFVYGLDLRLNGEFVPGTESWISLGLMSTEENRNNRGYIPRPTDQRFKFAMLFQDYVPSMPFLKMNLNLVYNSGLPGGAPNYADPYDYSGRLRDYKRADLGIFYVVNDDNKSRVPFLKDLMIGFEILNVFDVQNAISMTWVRDVSSKSQFGIPNYMTPRVFNLKLSAGF
jgi:predicted transcriptional regulator with HTH domain